MSKIVGRTLDFLELFADHRRPLSLSEIARLLDIPPSSCHDVLHTLQDRGYLYEPVPRGGFYPTRRIYEIAKTIADADPVVSRAEAPLRGLRTALDESVLLAKVTGLQATYLLAFEPPHPLRFQAKAGDPVRALHATSAGKALLGSLTESALDEYLRTTPLSALTPRTITDAAALRLELQAGNSRGWFENHDESQEGVTTLSARFLSIATVYIVSIAGPSSRMRPKLDRAAALLAKVCQELEAAPLPGAPPD